MFKELFSNRLFIGALAFFVLCVAGSLLYMHHENQKGAEYAAETRDRVAEWNAKQNPTTEGKAGETSQGGHVHENGTSHEGPLDVSVPVFVGVDESDTSQVVSDGEVIYPHHELLQSHPVEALRQLAIARGHWSAEWIPPFPADDVEANELARNYYLYTYYRQRRVYNPIASQARDVIDQWRSHFDSYIPSRRMEIPHREFDLMKLGWILFDYDAELLEMDIPSSFSREEYKPSNAPTTYTTSTFIPEDYR